MENNKGMSLLTKLFSLIVLILVAVYFLLPDIAIILPIVLIALSILIFMFGFDYMRAGGKITGAVAIIGSIASIALIVIKLIL